MNCFEGYLSIISLFDHHVQTSVMNIRLHTQRHFISFNHVTMPIQHSIFSFLSISVFDHRHHHLKILNDTNKSCMFI